MPLLRGLGREEGLDRAKQDVIVYAFAIGLDVDAAQRQAEAKSPIVRRIWDLR